MPGSPRGNDHLFGCRLSKVTAEGEQVEVSFVADSKEDLRKRLAMAHDVLHAHKVHENERIMRIADAERRRVEGAVLDVRDEVTHAQLRGRAAKQAREAGDGAASRAAHP